MTEATEIPINEIVGTPRKVVRMFRSESPSRVNAFLLARCAEDIINVTVSGRKTTMYIVVYKENETQAEADLREQTAEAERRYIERMEEERIAKMEIEVEDK